jgi:hypothetical protein
VQRGDQMVMTICVAITEKIEMKQKASSHLSKEHIFKGEEVHINRIK